MILHRTPMEVATRASAFPETELSGSVLDMQAIALSEARIAHHDGYLWPVARADMVTGPHIRQRMAEDLGQLIRERGGDAVVTTDDYLRLGWTRDQVSVHGGRAGDIYERDRRAAEQVHRQDHRSVA